MAAAEIPISTVLATPAALAVETTEASNKFRAWHMADGSNYVLVQIDVRKADGSVAKSADQFNQITWTFRNTPAAGAGAGAGAGAAAPAPGGAHPPLPPPTSSIARRGGAWTAELGACPQAAVRDGLLDLNANAVTVGVQQAWMAPSGPPPPPDNQVLYCRLNVPGPDVTPERQPYWTFYAYDNRVHSVNAQVQRPVTVKQC